MPTGVTLVAGAGGFIGGHLVAALLRDGHRVRAVDVKPLEAWYQAHPDAENLPSRDLRGRDACARAAAGAARVFNLAADMGGMGFIEKNRAACMLSVLINTHLLLAARDAGAGRYFFASSACVYAAGKQARPDVAALREEDAYPADAEDGYGWEKLFSERMCRHFREDFGLATRVARFHNVYGIRTCFSGGREKAPAAICRKVARAVQTGVHEIEIWGDGTATRSFMDVGDCVRGVLDLAASDVVEPLNLGSAELVSVSDLVTIVEDIAGVRLERRHDLSAPRGVAGRNSDNTRFRAAFGWEPSTPLRVGLERLYRWVYDELAAGRAGA